MTHTQLEVLTTEDFYQRFALIGSADGLYFALRRSPEVRSLHSALNEDIVTEEAPPISETDLNHFVRSLLRSFASGEQFDHQIAIAAIAVACEGVSKSFARQFIDYLANMESPELMLASLVARQARKSIPRTATQTFRLSAPTQPWQLLENVSRSDTRQTTQTIELELV